jgi:hypothetical protein
MHAIGKFLAIGFGGATLLLAPLANAQNQPSSPPPSSSQSTTTPGATVKPSDITDKKLDAAAKAVKQVSTVSESYKTKLAQAPASEKDKLLDQADKDVTKAVTDQGLSVEEYLGIMKVAENDATVRNKLIDRLK